jgi:PAS domain S-box-containing protein
VKPEPRPVKILLVDDEPSNLVALRAVLEAPDRELVEAGSGEEALRRLLRDKFAVILLDVQMPGIDGFETAELVRAREKSRDTPIIFLTAASRGEANVAAGYSVGAVDYIVKPFDPEVLRSKVAVFVELFRKTEQIERQAAQLAETTAFLNNILESATEYAIVAHDLDGTILAWNEGARRTYGYTAEEMVDKQDARVLFGREEIESGRVDAALTAALETGSVEEEFERVRKGGQAFVARVAVTLRRDSAGRPIGFLVISQDITEQKAEEARAQLLIREQAARAEAEAARRRFAFLAEASNVLASTLDSDTSLGDVARLAVPMLGDGCAIDLLQDGGQVRRVAAAGVVDGGKGPRLNDPLAVPTDLATSYDPVAHRIDVGPGGRSSLTVLVEAHGRKLGAISFSRSAPGRPYENGDIELAVDLARRVALAVESARLYRESQDAIRVRDDFLTSASHDLRTPLSVIKGQAQLLQRPAAEVEPPHQARLLEGLGTIDVVASKMAGLIDEMLDVARLRMGQPLELNPRVTDLVAQVHEAVEALGTRVRSRVRIESAEHQLCGLFDADRLDRVLANLLGNAIKYSPNGGEIVVAVAREEDETGRWAVVRVKDRGVGIPAEEQPRVFERFYRAHNVVGKIAGSGIGLAGVRQIVEEHGGTIDLASQEGVGTTVSVRLPLEDGEAPARPVAEGAST